MKGMKITIITELMTPSQNKFGTPKGHWIKDSFVKKFEKEFRAQQIYGDIPDVQLQPPCRITVKRFSARTLDPDNLVGGLKPMIDALVHIGLLQNDTKLKLRHGEHEQIIDRLNPHMEITLEELPEAGKKEGA